MARNAQIDEYIGDRSVCCISECSATSDPKRQGSTSVEISDVLQEMLHLPVISCSVALSNQTPSWTAVIWFWTNETVCRTHAWTVLGTDVPHLEQSNLRCWFNLFRKESWPSCSRSFSNISYLIASVNCTVPFTGGKAFWVVDVVDTSSSSVLSTELSVELFSLPFVLMVGTDVVSSVSVIKVIFVVDVFSRTLSRLGHLYSILIRTMSSGLIHLRWPTSCLL